MTEHIRGSSEYEIVAFLAWSEVFDEPFTSTALADRLLTCSIGYVLRGLSIIGTLLTNMGGMTGPGRRGLAAEFLDGSARDRALALFDSGAIRALVHPDAVLLATRLALRRYQHPRSDS